MQKLGKAIEEYLKSWIECDYCHDMCKMELITSDNEDKPICRDCNEQEYYGMI